MTSHCRVHCHVTDTCLVEAVQRDASPCVRAAAVHGLMRVGARAARSLLLALGDTDASVCGAAMEALTCVGLDGLVAEVHVPHLAHTSSRTVLTYVVSSGP